VERFLHPSIRSQVYRKSISPFVLHPPLFDSLAASSISHELYGYRKAFVGIAKTLKMGVSRQASHPISSIQRQASDTTVDPAVQWKLVQERANQTLSELLLLVLEALFLVLFVVRSIVQFLRSVVGDQVVFSVSRAQGEPTPLPLAPLLLARLLSPLSHSLPPVSKAVRPQVLSVNTLSQEPSQSQSLPPSQSLAPSPSSPLDEIANETVSLTYRELLEALNLPEDISSLDVLAKLGLLPEDTSQEPSPSPPLSPSIPSPPPYVPPQLRRTSSPIASSTPPHVPRQSAPAPPAPPAPLARSLGPPFISYVKVEKGCFYCHNKHPSSLRHSHRNHCPWFHHHLAVGTCHLNDRGELCLGPKRTTLARPLPFWSSTVSQGEQVKRRTDGTEWDEVVERRSWNPVVFSSGSVLVE